MGVAVITNWCGESSPFRPLCFSSRRWLTPEAMLLVHDDQREPREADALLEQGMGADDDLGPGPIRSLRQPACGRRRPPIR